MKCRSLKSISALWLLTLVQVLVSAANGAPGQSPQTPNIIVILADDMGYGDVHAFYPDSEIPTPNLDQLASEGVMFTDAHTPSSICTPTRYGLLTGRYCWRTELKRGVLRGYDPPLIEEERMTIADYLDQLGYQTAIVGKWHLGLRFQRNAPGTESLHEEFDLTKPLLHTPNKDGFDYSFVLPASLDFEPYLYVRNSEVVDTEFERVPTTEFPHFWREGIKSRSLQFDQVLNDLLGEAKAFIERASESENPFFLYFPLTAPHKPVIPTEDFIGTSGRGLYGDFVTQIDWTAGEILKLLEKLGLEEDTLVIFTSDNGSPMYSMNAATFPDHVTDETLAYYNERNHRANGYLRGIKGDLYEGGHRVPFIARWPGQVPRGQRTSELVCLTDIFDTIVDLTGGEKPAGAAEDSYSFAAQLLGRNVNRSRPPVIHHAGGAGMYAIRREQWKLILGNGSGARTDPAGRPFQKPFQLFNLDHDLSENINLVDLAPDLAGRLESEFRKIAGEDLKEAKKQNSLSQNERNSGWKLLWDGRTSQGWRAIYRDQFPETGWIMENGELICLGEELPEEERGGAIITDKKYSSFELAFEFKIKEGANSGIKYFVDERLKASMGHGLGLEYAILDDANFPYDDPEAKRTCGSLYDLVKAGPEATCAVGEWNQGRIVVDGNHIEHWLNGRKVVEVEKGTPHYRELVAKSKYKNIEGWGEFPEGHILIQDEGPRTAFRNIRIRELR